jgi:hypothetical protein
MGDLEVVKNMLSGKDISSLSLDEIADIIRKDWKKVYFGAVPYLEAMGSIDSSGMYLADPWQSIVAYFLGNANTWKGPVAKEVKAELKKRLKKNKMARLQKIATSLRTAAGDGILKEVADAIEGKSMMSMRPSLEKLFSKKYKGVVDFSTEPFPRWIIHHKGKSIAIVNKKNVVQRGEVLWADIVQGDYAIGFITG